MGSPRDFVRNTGADGKEWLSTAQASMRETWQLVQAQQNPLVLSLPLERLRSRSRRYGTGRHRGTVSEGSAPTLGSCLLLVGSSKCQAVNPTAIWDPPTR